MVGFDPWSYAEKYGKGRNAEHAEQTALFMWANMAYRFGLVAANDPASYTERGVAIRHLEQNNDQVKKLKWLHAIHNQGHGDVIRGGAAKAEGVKAGVADIFLPVPMRPLSQTWKYHGLYLELKVGSNKPSEIQVEFLADMVQAGYETGIAWGWLEARYKLLVYLGLSQ